jgi:RHS repeat-associated protein
MLNLANAPDDYRMQWDQRDMIGKINLGGGGFAHYQYDSGKQRTRKTIIKNSGNIIEERIYLGGLELYRRTLNGTPVEEIETLHLFDGEQRLLMIDQVFATDNIKLSVGVLYRYTLSNHLGSSSIELDHNAEIISYEEYHPYGTSAYRAGRNSAEVKLKRYRYTGMERDEESGLSYHTARFYLPWLGRWGSADPIGIKGGVNVFSYCLSNPIANFDRRGLQAENYEIGKKIEVIFEQVIEMMSENRSKNGTSPTVSMSTQKGYNKGNSFLDFEFRTLLDDQYLKSVDTKGLHIANYMDKKGNVDYGKITAKFEENALQSIKHATDAAKGNKLKSASETILYVLISTPQQQKKFPGKIKDVEDFLKVLGTAVPREKAGPRIGVGVVRFEDLYEKVKASGRKPGVPSKLASSAKIALVVAAVMTSTVVQAAEPDNKKPADKPKILTPAAKNEDFSAFVLKAKTFFNSLWDESPNVETTLLNKSAEKNESAATGYFDVVFDAFNTASNALSGEAGDTQKNKNSKNKSIEDKFGKQYIQKEDY